MNEVNDIGATTMQQSMVQNINAALFMAFELCFQAAIKWSRSALFFVPLSVDGYDKYIPPGIAGNHRIEEIWPHVLLGCIHDCTSGQARFHPAVMQNTAEPTSCITRKRKENDAEKNDEYVIN